MLRMLTQIQALSHDPDARDLVRSGALLAASLDASLDSLVSAHLHRTPLGDVDAALLLPLLFRQRAAASSRLGLDENTLDSLPEIVVSAAILERMRSSGETGCPVCHDTYIVGQRLLQLPCQHLFCDDCARTWLRRNNTCPNCRAEVEVEDARARSGTEWHSEDLFPFRFPQGSPLAAVRRARLSHANAAGELWPPVDDMARIAEQHSAWPAPQQFNPISTPVDLAGNADDRLGDRMRVSTTPSASQQDSPHRSTSRASRALIEESEQERQTERNPSSQRQGDDILTPNPVHARRQTHDGARSSLARAGGTAVSSARASVVSSRAASRTARIEAGAVRARATAVPAQLRQRQARVSR